MDQSYYIRPEWEQKIDELLSKMTTAEKIGQLTLVGPSPVGGFEISLEEQKKLLEAGRITKEEYDRAVSAIPLDKQEDGVRAGHIGAFIGVRSADKCDHLQRVAVEQSRLHIPLLFGLDVIHGQHTVFPIPLAESCSFDDALWEKTAAVAAKEAAADGIMWTFAPMVDIARDARWGRIAEGAGEDTYLGTRCAAAKVKGFQGEDVSAPDRLIACAKHYVAYGACEGGRDYNTVDMSEQTLYDTYLPPFAAAVKNGVGTVMPAFNDLNGVPCTTNQKLLQTILREQMGFEGFTVSDANAIAECVDHASAADREDAARQALVGGTDMDMGSFCYPENLEVLVKKGAITETQIDEAVRRVLRLKFARGLFENPYCRAERQQYPADTHRALAREAAVKSAVLLQNDGILPLKADAEILLVGELADARREMLGTWTLMGKAEDTVSVKDALLRNGVPFTYIPCCGPQTEMDEAELSRAVKHTAKTVIAVVGENAAQSGEAASRSDISLPGEQLRLIQALHAAGKTVIAVLCNGRPLALDEAAEVSAAMLELWHAGTEAGNAAFDLLYGKENPSGRLSVTFPQNSGTCPVYYNHPATGRPATEARFSVKYIDAPVFPRFPFGFGLSYTAYQYSDLSVSVQDGAVAVSVTVKNAGEMAGTETVQVYIRDLVASRVRPVLELKEFTKVHLAHGEKRTVTFCLPLGRLAFFDSDMQRVVEPGDFRLQVGHDSTNGLTADFTVTTAQIAEHADEIRSILSI